MDILFPFEHSVIPQLKQWSAPMPYSIFSSLSAKCTVKNRSCNCQKCLAFSSFLHHWHLSEKCAKFAPLPMKTEIYVSIPPPQMSHLLSNKPPPFSMFYRVKCTFWKLQAIQFYGEFCHIVQTKISIWFPLNKLHGTLHVVRWTESVWYWKMGKTF